MCFGDGQPYGSQGRQDQGADREHGLQVLYLPPYSSDLNPIEDFGLELPLGVLFDAPTVAELALVVTQTKAEAEADIDQMLAQVEQMQSRSVSQRSYEGQ